MNVLKAAKVSLAGEAEKKTLNADNYGDFEFDGLQADKVYTIKIEASGYRSRKFEVKTNIDRYLGDIVLAKIAAKKAGINK